MRWDSVLLEDGLIDVCHLRQLGDEEVLKNVKVIHPIPIGGISIFLLEKVGSNESHIGYGTPNNQLGGISLMFSNLNRIFCSPESNVVPIDTPRKVEQCLITEPQPLQESWVCLVMME